MKSLKLIVSALLFSATILSCQKEPQPIKVTGISINPTTLTLTEGDTQTLTASVSPSNADVQGVSWSTSNSSVATVNNGKVTAIKAGSATITVKSDDGGKTATCEVTVNAKTISVESVSLDKTSLELTEGDKATLTATVKPENAENKNITWSSSDESIVTISNGEVTAVKAGTAKITVKTEDGAKTAECSVTVKEKIYAVESVSLDKTSLELTEGDKATLVATVAPENATNKNVTWSSSDESVATVSNGEVTAVKAGTAKITVKTEDGDKTAECSVTIKAKTISVEMVSLDKTENTIMIGDVFILTATIEPNNATNKNVTWSSSDESVASVEDGTVTAKAEGTTTITVTTEDGSKTATCIVTVTNDITQFVSASYLGGSEVIINGLIQYGSRMNFGISNNSSKTIHVESIQLIDGVSFNEGNVMPIDTDLEGHQSTGWSITIGLMGIRKPIAKIVYTYEGVEHSVQAQYNEPDFPF